MVIVNIGGIDSVAYVLEDITSKLLGLYALAIYFKFLMTISEPANWSWSKRVEL
jgi:hypothetical protein